MTSSPRFDNTNQSASAAELAADTARQTQAEDRNSGAWHLAGLAYHALVFSAFQQPLDALAQVGNHATKAVGIGDGKVFSAPHLTEAPAAVAFGSRGWVAETIGSGAGMVLPFMVADGMVSKTGSLLKDTRVAALAQSLPLADKLMPLARPVASGALYGALFTPSNDNDFLSGRLKNAAAGGLTFGSQRAFTLGLTRGLGALGVPAGEAAFDATWKGMGTRVLSNAAGGTMAGLVNANAEALLNHGRLATSQENSQSALSFAVTGGVLDMAHIGGAKLGELTGRMRASAPAGVADTTGGVAPVADAKGTEPAARPQPADDLGPRPGGGGSGAMSEVQSRLSEGSEAEREAASDLQLTPKAVAARQALQETLAGKYGVEQNSAAGQHFNNLIEQAGKRQFRTAEMNPDEMHELYGSVDRLLNAERTAVPLTEQQRLQVAAQMLREAATVPEGITANPADNSLLAMMQTLQYKFPGKTAGMLTDLITTGQHNFGGRNAGGVDLSDAELAKLPPEYRQTLQPSPQAAATLFKALDASPSSAAAAAGRLSYVQELMQTLGMNTITQDPISGENKAVFAVNRVNGQHAVFEQQEDGTFKKVAAPEITVPRLQHVFERLSNTEKGSYVLKNGAPFVLAEPDGTYKLFADDTNYLNWGWRLNGKPLDLVSARMDGGFRGTIDGANRAGGGLDEHAIHVSQATAVVDNGVHQRITIENTGSRPQVVFAQRVAHDFLDMFEVRGWKRSEHGQQLPTKADDATSNIRYSYQGLDGHVMTSDVHLSGVKPSLIEENAITWLMSLAPGEKKIIDVGVLPGLDAPPVEWAKQPSFEHAWEQSQSDYEAWRKQYAQIETSDPRLNEALEQTFRDLYVLRQPTPRGEAIAAGLPWFASLFGRDDLLTAMQVLPFMPDSAAKVLRTLAAYQGTKEVAATGEKPGKILHELRVGEMARAGEIPFAPSYHTVDATPLFLSLLGRYVQTTGDTQLVKELQPNIDAALAYLDAEVQRGKGYLTYGGHGKEPLSNQGWKDSGDSIPYSNGELAQAPIALSEVQGYLYDGWKQTAGLERLAGNEARAQELEAKAAALQQRFQRDYWMPDKNFVALALDGQGHQADVVSSNPGHLLMTGILSDAQAHAVSDRLMQPDMYNGWGIGTLSSLSARFFPNSYHDGSVWPHDNSIIGIGLHDYAPENTARLMWSLYEVASQRPAQRLPELFGGYDRARYSVPVPYPVACEPQAWSAAVLMSMINSSLGGKIDALHNRVSFDRPSLPPQLDHITVRGYRVGNNSLDVNFVRQPDGTVNATVLNNPGAVQVEVKH